MGRLLITGGSGLLALNWACRMRHQLDVILGTHRQRVNLEGARSVALDLESPDHLSRQLQALAPTLVIHTAGMTRVEQCEQQPRDAEHANAGLARNVAIATHALGIKLVHISTDHLFSGSRSRVTEEELPEPLNVYARTKLQAEKWVREANPKTLIVRTNFFGWGHLYRQSFSDWIITSLRSGRRITMFENVYFTPILADSLAFVTHAMVAKEISGVLNIAGDERFSKYDFAICVAERFRLPKALVVRGRMDDLKPPVRRPHDMSLDNTKVSGLLGRPLGKVDEFLEELYEQEQQGRTTELQNAVLEQ